MWQGRFCINGTLIKRDKEEARGVKKSKAAVENSRFGSAGAIHKTSRQLLSLPGDPGLGAAGRHVMSAIVASLARAVWCAFDQETVTKKALPHRM